MKELLADLRAQIAQIKQGGFTLDKTLINRIRRIEDIIGAMEATVEEMEQRKELTDGRDLEICNNNIC